MRCAVTSASALPIAIRQASISDISLILSLIRELAEYEKLAHEVVATEEILAQSLFGENPKAFAVIAEAQGKSAGFALYFYNFSTFLGQPGLYVEDLYVKPEFRGQGIGKQLLRHLAQKTVAERCGRLEWCVLDWNEPALEFYRSLGAVPMDEWTVYRLAGAALAKIAA